MPRHGATAVPLPRPTMEAPTATPPIHCRRLGHAIRVDMHSATGDGWSGAAYIMRTVIAGIWRDVIAVGTLGEEEGVDATTWHCLRDMCIDLERHGAGPQSRGGSGGGDDLLCVLGGSGGAPLTARGRAGAEFTCVGDCSRTFCHLHFATGPSTHSLTSAQVRLLVVLAHWPQNSTTNRINPLTRLMDSKKRLNKTLANG